MIGVIADSPEQEVVREFFELFKTPWEFCLPNRRYDVLICAGAGQFDETAKLVVLYSGGRTYLDDERKIDTGCQRNRACTLSHQGDRIPIYGDTITFLDQGSELLKDEDSQQCVAYLDRSKKTVLARIGYDLFGEVRTLLAVGQPPANAGMPAVELHIALLRDLITRCGVSLVEVPPVPDGYRFIACLTHDVDHPSIRQHKWDHTMFGFLRRGVFGSLLDFVRGRIPARDLAANWAAALKLPLVHLGLAKDFWRDFDGRYLELEEGVRSTFFVIPFKDRSGTGPHGPAPTFRAARYGARDIANTIQRLLTAGCEVGLHGLDAWVDSSRGRDELEEIRRLTGAPEIGVRMHWLYYDQLSPVALEKAGASYDSTIGYNETVGYRAGTTQVYKPLTADRLLELPLHVMDTALFYPVHLGLSDEQARTVLGRIVDGAVRFGGCLTINWHDRSVAPERLWDRCYRDLLRDLKSKGAWFATAGQATSWFRKRRSVVFETGGSGPDAVRARVPADYKDDLPGMRLRIHKARESSETAAPAAASYADTSFDGCLDAMVPFGVPR